jgi:indole-3-glycerol phosphate synthase
MSVLRELVEHARARAAALRVPAPEPTGRRASFRDAIAGKAALSVIAEFKRASPSQGAIDADAEVEARVRAYAQAGAAALSVLTEPSRFSGSSDDLRRAAQAVALPCLMKDFVVAPVQVELAAALGASAVLLIVRCLEPSQLADLAAASDALGLTPLVECHSEAELEPALAIDSAVIGVNNRDLDTLAIDPERAPRLLRRIPAERVAVAESGYRAPVDVAPVRGLADAVLIGTALMAQSDPRAFVRGVAGR